MKKRPERYELMQKVIQIKNLCKDYKLDWTQGPVKILGVTFTTNVYDIWDFNSIEILKKVKAMSC